jgi:hypothetical protein
MGISLGSEQFQIGNLFVELFGELRFQLGHPRLAVGHDLAGVADLLFHARDGIGKLLRGRLGRLGRGVAKVVHGVDKLLLQVGR